MRAECGGVGCVISPQGKAWGHSEGANVTQHRQTNYGTARKTKRNRGPFPQEGSNAALWPLVCSQNKGSCPGKYWRGDEPVAIYGPRSREAGARQPEVEGKRSLQFWPQRWHQPPSCEQTASYYPHLPGSWKAQICQECHSLRLAPLRSTAHLGLCPCSIPRSLALEGACTHWIVATPVWSNHWECSPHIPAAFAESLPLQGFRSDRQSDLRTMGGGL